ncbi:hypothetical protein NDU88_000357 [Pleurodeles waltl]|uniref:Uncharacterized protein n=1 Tax=Pleurodeles waltl TaxID=8319 RepID=A0AAV7P0L5_PLEWA|nr:hypothetical protein NDU88_000357 [Pleurodeles waltl]
MGSRAPLKVFLFVSLILAFSSAVLPGKGKSTELFGARNKRDAEGAHVANMEEEEGVKMVEVFQADSSGEGSVPVNMGRREKGTSVNAAAKEHLFDMALCINLSSLLFFLCGTFSWT